MNIKSNTPDRSDMNELDSKFFDTYLEGDSPLSEVYQKVDCAQPSNKLNQTILSAARASAEQSSGSKSGWTQAGSWAASVAIISLAGLLAHNTWQAEQDAVHKELQGESPNSFSQTQTQADLLAKPDAVSRPYKAGLEADIQVEQEVQVLSRAKKSISRDKSKDSRMLLYKSAPAPVMQSAPEHFELNKTAPLLKASQIQGFADVHKEIQHSPEVKAERAQEKPLAGQTKPLAEQQAVFKQITQLIENNKIEQAQALLLQFKTKYPDYPVDPVILKHLSPY